jgi:hypothetical protein
VGSCVRTVEGAGALRLQLGRGWQDGICRDSLLFRRRLAPAPGKAEVGIASPACMFAVWALGGALELRMRVQLQMRVLVERRVWDKEIRNWPCHTAMPVFEKAWNRRHTGRAWDGQRTPRPIER